MANKKTSFKEAISSEIFSVISKASQQLQVESYVIGGFVRDFFLKRGTAKDIDVVAVGSGIELAQKVAKLLPNKPKVQVFKTYGTAMLRYKDIEIEFVGARKESYSEESRNPEVEAGTLQDDQNRRDFTINALALSLNENNFGELLDPFNGLNDLENKVIKNLPIQEFLETYKLQDELFNEQITANELKALQESLPIAIDYAQHKHMQSLQGKLSSSMFEEMVKHEEKVMKWKAASLEQLEVKFENTAETNFMKNKKEKELEAINSITADSSQYLKNVMSLADQEAYIKVMAVFFNA